MLDMRQVTKVYRTELVETHALRSLDLHVGEGEFVAVTGPSGSGKTTFLNIAGLLETFTGGQFLLDGQDVSHLGDDARSRLRNQKIGFIFQGFNLVPVMSVADNVDYPLFLSGVPNAERRQRVAGMLEKVGLTEQARRRPDALSGGQRQRVAVARALIKNPRLVIADEPTANLDSQTAEQVIALIRELCHEENAACLVATHDERMTRRCDRVLAMRDGCLLAPTASSAQHAQGVNDEVA